MTHFGWKKHERLWLVLAVLLTGREMMSQAPTATAPTGALAGQFFSSLPTPSVWRLNAAMSDFGGGPIIQEDLVTIITSTPSWFRYKEHEVMASGQTVDLSWEGPLDGSLQKMRGAWGCKASFTSQGEARFIIRGGLLEIASFVLSDDKKVLKQIVTLQYKSGEEQHAIWIYDRIQ